MKKHLSKILIFSTLFLIFFSFFFVYADDENPEDETLQFNLLETIESSSEATEIPEINAKHAVVYDRNSHQAIYGKKEDVICKMASTTKIMTAIVVLENSNLDDMVTVSNKAAQTGGSRLGLSKSDKITVRNLLYGLMMKSGNDAAVALAEHTGGSIENFASMMNAKAKELKLISTHFVTPHGLDNDDHFTTALDLAILTDYALKNETFCKIVKTKTFTVYINKNPKTINNTNELLGNYEGIYGVKTGFTNGANRCLVTSCKRGDLDIICVVLGCDTKKFRTQDSIKLLNYIFKNYTVVNIKDILIKNFKDWNLIHKNCFTISKGNSNNLDLYLDTSDFAFTHIAVNNSDLKNISTNIAFNSYFNAPLKNNTKIGAISLNINNKSFFSVDILSKNTINKKNCFNYLIYIFKNYYNFWN